MLSDRSENLLNRFCKKAGFQISRKPPLHDFMTKNSGTLKRLREPTIDLKYSVGQNTDVPHNRIVTILIAVTLLLPAIAGAHNVSKNDAKFVESNQGRAIAP